MCLETRRLNPPMPAGRSHKAESLEAGKVVGRRPATNRFKHHSPQAHSRGSMRDSKMPPAAIPAVLPAMSEIHCARSAGNAPTRAPTRRCRRLP